MSGIDMAALLQRASVLAQLPLPPVMTERKGRKLLYARSSRVCEKCGQRRATEAHHRKNRSQGGTWCPSNLLHLCPPCHHDVTVHVSHALVGGWACTSRQTPANEPARLASVGWALLNTDGSIQTLERSHL